MLKDISGRPDKRVIVGPGDDAGVYLLDDDTAVVETVDVITPVVDDPFTFGAISATNSLSDVYAMGGRPLTAMAILGFPSCDYGPEIIKEILHGAVNKLREAGVVLMGGHSIEDQELKFGLSVTGVIKKERILRIQGAIPGDILILTKPLGIGILTTALKGRKLEEDELKKVIELMLTLNDRASKSALNAKAHAMTDITGFGLLGHSYNMVRDSEIDFNLSFDSIPILPRVREMIDSGMVPEGAYNNLKFLKEKVSFPDRFSEENKLILFDPQTSGGLLIAIPQESLRIFEKESISFSVIGKVEKGKGRIRVS
ncbi:MAG: selenide, water dikinase SelD [Nitrospirae bacterium]|nr:selenide, water dikinase SelD [Nitrospirota bacterium]